MSKINFQPELFLGQQELSRLQQFASDNTMLLQQLGRYGIFRSIVNNFKVSLNSTSKPCFATQSYAIDKDGLLISAQPQALDINNPSSVGLLGWWVVVEHSYSSIEQGTVSIDVSGNLTGVGTKFLSCLRGRPNFPTKVSFVNSQSGNTIEYTVVEVVDDTNAILVGTFNAEQNLSYKVIGTFTPGTIQSTDQKNPYLYNSCKTTIVAETSINNPPVLIADKQFLVARLAWTNTGWNIQDRRSQFVESYESKISNTISNIQNPVVGVEGIVWNHPSTPRDQNKVIVGWGFEVTNHILNATLNQITVRIGSGGRFKSCGDFTDGDFNGWRVYNSTGQWITIISSSSTGGQITLICDILDIYVHFPGQTLYITPPYDMIEFKVSDRFSTDFNGDVIDDSKSIEQVFAFNCIDCKGSFWLYNFGGNYPYNIQYRYKNGTSVSSWLSFYSDLQGYYSEASYNDDGQLTTAVRKPYIVDTNDPNAGFIVVSAPVRNYFNTVDTRLITGVSFNNTPNQGTIDFEWGVSKQFQVFQGAQNLAAHIYLNLKSPNAKDGSVFSFTFQSQIGQGPYTVKFIQDNDTATVLYSISRTDLSFMGLSGKKVIVHCVYSISLSQWQVWRIQGDNNQLGEIVMRSNVSINDFDTSGKGINELVGWAICNGNNGTVDLRKKFIVGYDTTSTEYDLLTTGGVEKVTLSIAQMPRHNHTGDVIESNQAGLIRRTMVGDNKTPINADTVDSGNEPDVTAIPKIVPYQGGDEAHENRPPYIALAYVQRIA